MIEKIEAKPPIPKALRLAATQGNIIPFIGAGVSQLAGCPSWDQLANDALKFFVHEKKITHAQLNQISTLSSRVKLSVAMDLQRQHNVAINFQELLKPSSEKRALGDEVYANLSKLATNFITTNYDEWLDKTPPATLLTVPPSSQSMSEATLRQVFYKRQDLIVENLYTGNAVFHIHGSVRDQQSMVLTTVDYLQLYASHRVDGLDRENPYLTFLQELFKQKNVLFIGYGLNELEILEYVVQKGIGKQETNSRDDHEHNIIQGFFSHEVELARSLENYFANFGIGLLPFSRDESDWEQLADVVTYLARQIPPGPPLALSRRREMEELLS